MDQDNYKASPSSDRPYYWFLTFSRLPQDKLKYSSLGELVKDEVGKKFIKDAKAMLSSAPQEDYNGLKSRLVGSFSVFNSDQSFRSSVASEVDDKFHSILSYITIMKERFGFNNAKFADLKKSLYFAFFDKVLEKSYSPQWFLGRKYLAESKPLLDEYYRTIKEKPNPRPK